MKLTHAIDQVIKTCGDNHTPLITYSRHVIFENDSFRQMCSTLQHTITWLGQANPS